MTIRFPKVRITDNRPPGVAASPTTGARTTTRATRGGSVQQLSGLDHLSRIESKMQDEHDKAVAYYPVALLRSVYEDIHARHLCDRKNPESRWLMHRKAACLRRLSELKPI